VSITEKMLEGSILGNPDIFGQTLREERHESGTREWPNFSFDFEVQNQDIKLYGGSQFQRLLNEFEFVAHSQEFPPTSIHEVASAIGLSKSHTVPVFEIAASDIVKMKARTSLLPLVGCALKRSSYIMKRIFEISVAVIGSQEMLLLDPNTESIGKNDRFLTELCRVYNDFVDGIESRCRARMIDDFESLTKVIDWDLLSSYSPNTEFVFSSQSSLLFSIFL